MIGLQPVTLRGFGVVLEPLTVEHARGLADATRDGELWNLHFTFVPRPEDTEAYIVGALEGYRAGSMLPWAVRRESDGRIIGSTRYHDVVAEIDRVEIGYTWYAQSAQGGFVNPACKMLLLAHAFDGLGCAAVGLRTDAENLRSQAAIAKLGAKRDGTIRHFGVRRDGSARDTVMFSMLRDEWPAVRAALEHRLRGWT